MSVNLKVLHQNPADALFEAALYISRGETARAEGTLERLAILERLERDGEDLRIRLFHRGLARRLGRDLSREKSLYLRDFGVRQIDLFNLMATRMPLVSQGAGIANELLLRRIIALGALGAHTVDSAREVVLLDIGIGTGRQEVELLARLAALPLSKRPARLNIVGVEPALAALQQARASIAEAARTAGIEVRFEGICGFIEDCDLSLWSRSHGPGKALCVNAAFAFHHVRDKAAVLARIRELGPEIFVLTEPCSDHETADFMKRFSNAWRHFGLVFEVIDSLGLSYEERSALKSQFFGREIEDILGAEEADRSERHETGDQWADRLAAAGFALERPQLAELGKTDSVIELNRRTRFLTLDLRGQPIVTTLSAFAPDAREAAPRRSA